MIRKSKENYFKVNINNCNGDSGRLWKTLKNVLPKKPSVNPSAININGNILESIMMIYLMGLTGTSLTLLMF